jgi:hypothetical protein
MRKTGCPVLRIYLVLAQSPVGLAFFDTQGHWPGNTIRHLAARDIVHGKSTEILLQICRLPGPSCDPADRGLDLAEETRLCRREQVHSVTFYPDSGLRAPWNSVMNSNNGSDSRAVVIPPAALPGRKRGMIAKALV